MQSGLLTVKARSTSLEDLIDLETCETIKYEEDYFGEVDYSISSELKFKKEDWIADPSKASVQQVQAFFSKRNVQHWPSSSRRFSSPWVPDRSGVAKMYSAEFKLNHPLARAIQGDRIQRVDIPRFQALSRGSCLDRLRQG